MLGLASVLDTNEIILCKYAASLRPENWIAVVGVCGSSNYDGDIRRLDKSSVWSDVHLFLLCHLTEVL